jgi:nucleoside phosphorylase/CheY-like chemotaxis protein
MTPEIKILVVDDNEEKRSRVTAILYEKLAPRRVYVGEAANYEEALSALQQRFFDLVVLDLLLPAAGQPPSEITSRALISLILQGRLLPPMHIIGLTEFPEAKEKERQFYDENLFALEHYAHGDVGWADRIIGKVKYLMRSKNAAIQFQNNSYDLDVFVLAARYENEYLPVRRKLFSRVESERHPIWGGSIALGSIKRRDRRSLDAGLACVGEMGMAPTAAVAAQAITVFRPRLIAMLGMCCGFATAGCSSPRKLMDAIIVRQVACWEEGKYVEQTESGSEFRNRSKTRMVDDLIRDEVEAVVERSSETITPPLKKFAQQREYEGIRKHFGAAVRDVPDVRFGTLVSGSSVIADEAAVGEILQRHPAAIGLDMEIFGLYTAADRCLGQRPSVLGIKGVADFGHAAKDDFAQKGASIVSAEVFKSVLANLRIFDV